LAWMMYANDCNDYVSPNRDGGDVQGWQSATANWTKPVTYSKLSWAGGWEDFANNTTDNTNILNLLFGALGSYAKNTGLYHCPADNYPAKEGNITLLRVRSNSMNGFVGERQNDRTTGQNDWYPTYIQYVKSSSFTRPGPANTWLLVDEHPDSINDGYFLNKWPTPPYNDREWIDLPASYHNGGASFSFADGHSETHRWRNPSTKQPANPNSLNLPMDVPGDQTTDYYWTVSRMSVSRDN